MLTNTNKQKQSMNFTNQQYVCQIYNTTNLWIFFHTFFSYLMTLRNFDIGMFVWRSSILVQVSRKIFGVINKRLMGVQIRIEGVLRKQKLTSGGRLNCHSR